MDIEKIKKANTKYLGKQIQYYKELRSTQDRAKELVNLNVANGDLFNKDYREILKKIDPTENVLDKYRFAELSRYTSSTLKKRIARTK